MSEPLVLTFRSPPTRERARQYVERLVSPRLLLVLVPSLVPGIALLALDANPPFPAWAFGIGVGYVLFVLAAGLLSTVVQAPPPFTLTVDEQGVRESREGKEIDSGLDWVLGLRREGDVVTLRVRGEPARSFRLSTPSAQVLTVDAYSTSPATLERLERIFATKREA